MRIQAVLFDLDGTLRDSRPAILPAAQHALEYFGHPVDDISEVLQHTHNLHAIHENFAPHVEYEAFRRVYHAKVESLLHTIYPYPNHKTTLEQLKQASYRLALVSSSRFAQESVQTDGISELLELCIGGLDTEHHKPHPEPILLALTRLNVQPEQVVMVGDLPADILASKAAGLRAAIGVTHGFGTRQMLQDAGADYLVDSLREILPTLAIIEQS